MVRSLCAAVCLLVALAFGAVPDVSAQTSSPFGKLAGLWVGEGRLGVRDGGAEAVKCRVTYRPEAAGMELKQAIRCASAGGSIEVKVAARAQGATISGEWEETTRNWKGRLSGTTTERGLRVGIKGDGIAANMDIIVKDKRQIVEIQFLEGALIGLSIALTKQE